jgi:cation:H+ antiporter
VLGASAMVLPQVLQSKLKFREVFWLLGSLALLWFVIRDFELTRMEGVLLVGTCLVYNLHILFTGKEGPESAPGEDVGSQDRFKQPIAWTLIGIVCIALGAKFVVDSAGWGAARLGIPPGVVALTVVALGTSLPELAAGLNGAFKGESDISIGNVVGSNILNILAAIGVVGIVSPFGISQLEGEAQEALRQTLERSLNQDLVIVCGFSLAAILLPYLGGARGGRFKGFLLVSCYAYFVFWLYQSRGLPV